MSVGGELSVTQADIDTDNVTEGSTNIFFTDSRARSAFSAAGDLNYNASTGEFSIDQSDLNVDDLISLTGRANGATHLAAFGGSTISDNNTIKGALGELETAVEANAADLTAATGANLDLSQKSTTDLSEGTNLYYTDARADARVDAGFTAKSTTDLSEGTNLYYTDARADARIALAAGDYATAAQGTTADSAVQPGDNISTLTNDSNFIDAAGAPVQSVAGQTGAVTLVKGDVGLGNVDNTSDADKPVSTAQQTALDAKQDTLVAADYSSTTTTLATGSTVDVTINAGRSVNDVLVFADGLMKLPTTDYTISGTTLTFAVAPGNGVVVHVRYLPLG